MRGPSVKSNSVGRGAMGIPILSGDWKVLISREKAVWGVVLEPVPQTDTGGLVEYTKAFEKEWFKELGKKAGRNLWEKPCPNRAPFFGALVRAAAKVCQPTVYQKHSSLQIRIGDV